MRTLSDLVSNTVGCCKGTAQRQSLCMACNYSCMIPDMPQSSSIISVLMLLCTFGLIPKHEFKSLDRSSVSLTLTELHSA